MALRVRVYSTLPRPRWHWTCDICGRPDHPLGFDGFPYVSPWRRMPLRARWDGRRHVRRMHFPYSFGMTTGESENARKARASKKHRMTEPLDSRGRGR